MPEGEQIATPLEPPSAPVTQLGAFGAHTPWHEAAPLVPTQAWLPQSTGFPHWPAVHVWSPLPEHCVVPAVQTPEHCAPVQAPLAHAWGAPHVPVPSQVSRPVPMH